LQEIGHGFPSSTKYQSLWAKPEPKNSTFSVGDIFEPVTWHHQRRPLFYVLACKTRKTRRGLAGEASSDDQVSPVSKEEGEEERANNRSCF
jgi:hypothetical protein